MSIKLWHCHNSRSLRALWALEELGLDYELELLSFPPRVFDPDYLNLNPLGTVPLFHDAKLQMTESCAIPLYLVERYQRYEFGLKADHPEYGDYLNWLFHSDATLTFPQTLVLRYGYFEAPERRLPQVAEDYRRWYLSRLKRLNAHLESREYLCDDRFTIADICITYALYLGEILGLEGEYKPQVQAYLQRMKQREAFQKVVVIGEETSNFKSL
ncbi:glutathione S-transferase family protein [Parahaliea sp. F7430]|uniref:Glutathione S-transferase family protein n=1 Tax=Sediminihaliea albiluteola TaxID=2758564 RepID=A0A7W2TUM3_9GAMM|nr:glutathione S-transferase family protein [Sediminihaliea albiluteola]MBA6412272.1 glutathione S-transferase family protein [Sediminihaliea albiluteola]